MLLGPKELLDEAENLLAAVRGSRLEMVTVETAGITTGVYAFFVVVALGMSGVGDAGDSETGEAGDSKVGEAGESLMGEAGDSTMVSTGESMTRQDVGESMSGESGGARRGESPPVYLLQEGSFLSFVSETLGFFFAGSSSSPGSTWPVGRNPIIIRITKITI